MPTPKRKRTPLRSAPQLPAEIEVFRIDNLSHWPYESVASVTIARPSDPLLLTSTMVGSNTTHRCYDPDGDPHFSWALVPHNFYRDSTVPDDDALELSAAWLVRPREKWVQIEHVMFHSISASDDSILQPARHAYASGDLTWQALPASLRPDSVAIGSIEDPHYAWYESGAKTDKPSTTLFLSRPSKLPYINEHMIPKGANYAHVAASVFCYRSYSITPTYADCLKDLRLYCQWFAQYLSLRQEHQAGTASGVRRIGSPARPNRRASSRKAPGK